MKQFLFLLAQALFLIGASAQPNAAPARPVGFSGAAGPVGFATPGGPGSAPTAQDLQEQRRNQLRAALQSQRDAPLDQGATMRRLSPDERAELREQLRQQMPRSQESGRP